MAYSYKIEQAIKAAAVLHKDQVRKGSVPFPYVTHLFAVATIVSDYTDDEDTIITALLHDTLEDTDYTPQELQDDFGGPVKEFILALTEPEPTGEPGSWTASKKQYVKQLKAAKEQSLIVCAADKIHNMRCIIDEYFDKHAEFMADFRGSLENRLLMYQEISTILNRRLQSEILDEFNHVFEEYKKFIKHIENEQNFS